MKVWQSAVMAYIGGMLYVLIELVWRGWSHGSMFVVGGLCFLLLGVIHRRLGHTPLLMQAVLGAVVISAMELLSGLYLNVFLDLRVWDYSGLPYNLLGQVCVAYFFLWIWVAMAGCPLAGRLQQKLFGSIRAPA